MCVGFTNLCTWDDDYRFLPFVGETPTNWGPSYNVYRYGGLWRRNGRPPATLLVETDDVPPTDRNRQPGLQEAA